jgi:hypothetical protein
VEQAASSSAAARAAEYRLNLRKAR